MSDEKFLRFMYRASFNKKLDLANPELFNEKMQWLKLNDRKEIYTVLVDKYLVKEYISSKIGSEYVVKTLGVWDDFSDIDFESLPNRFVLKCTHDSGSVFICSNKELMNWEHIEKEINNAMKKNYFWKGREWPYKNIKPRIIAEEFIGDEQNGLDDYKFMCFNGKMKCCFVCTDRKSPEGVKITIYDEEWRRLSFHRHGKKSRNDLKKPKGYMEMIKISEKLSRDIPFLRVDFYEANGKIYVGELTFFPANGVENFTPSEWDKKLGDWLVLPNK